MDCEKENHSELEWLFILLWFFIVEFTVRVNDIPFIIQQNIRIFIIKIFNLIKPDIANDFSVSVDVIPFTV